MKKVYYDIADNFVKDLEKKLNKSIEKNEKENKIKIENEIIKYEEKDIGVRSFSVPYFVENQTIINYDGNNKELINKIEDICTAYTDKEIEAIEETMPILKKYSEDLKRAAEENQSEVDLLHYYFLLQIMELLEHNDFLTAQSQKIREFYQYMAKQYPYLSFTFKGRIKSLIRAEAKFNGYIVAYVYDYYLKNHAYPPVDELKERLTRFRDLIAYRIVISMPKCHVRDEREREQEEIRHLYEIANRLKVFLEERGFTAEPAGGVKLSDSPLLNEDVRPYYRDYIVNEESDGYRSLHITFFDNSAHCYVEMQLRTKTMDDIAEIGPANHLGYEKKQERERARRDVIPVGECIYFDEAYERGMKLQQLELPKLDVNMFAAIDNSLINDGCGLYRGRLILPYEHLSRFQND